MASTRPAARKRIHESETLVPPASLEPSEAAKLPNSPDELTEDTRNRLYTDIETLLRSLGITRDLVKDFPRRTVKDTSNAKWNDLSKDQLPVALKLHDVKQYLLERTLDFAQRHKNTGDKDQMERMTNSIARTPLQFAITDSKIADRTGGFLPANNEEADATILSIEKYLGSILFYVLPDLAFGVVERWAKLRDGEKESISWFKSVWGSLPDKIGARTFGQQMRSNEDRAIIHDGVKHFPLSVAASIAQAPRSTLLDWIKKGTAFNGKPLDSYYFAPVNRYFISEESVIRAANRFVKWPSGSPAGPVKLGETKDHDGYVGLTHAARAIGVDHHTLWLWATQNKAPTDQPLDVIKCPASDQYYVHERDISRLKKLVPRTGLRRGRRPQLEP